jgi:uncharacterized protein (DUF305 family)
MLSKRKYALGLSAVALVSGLALAGCSSSGSGSGSSASGGSDMSGMNHGSMPMSATPSASTTAGTFNDADVMFAQMMIPHHQQAVEMSDDVLGKSGVDGRVTSLAQKIKAAQQPEIAQLTSWLGTRGKPAPSSSAAMTGMGEDGMMSSDDMAKLKSADGSTASKLFLSQMIAHHEGAVAMAKTEASSGSDAKAVAMAKSIVDSQTAEITEMKGLLASL